MSGPVVTVPYSTFLAQARASNVAAVTINGQAVTGTFRTAILYPSPDPSASPTPSADAAAVAASYTSFATTLPPMDDPALLPVLESTKVEITAKETGGGSVLLNLAISIVPLVLLVGFLAYQGRRVQQSQAGIFGFGGSKARVYDAERPKVTFADVAGAGRGEEGAASRSSTSSSSPTSTAGWGHACPGACCSSARRAPARP